MTLKPQRGSWGSLLVCGLVVLGGGLWLDCEPVQALTNHEYCLQFTRAERMECRAEGMARRANCIDDFAFGQWIDDPGAGLEYNLCLLETKQYVLDCLEQDITDCSTW